MRPVDADLLWKRTALAKSGALDAAKALDEKRLKKPKFMVVVTRVYDHMLEEVRLAPTLPLAAPRQELELSVLQVVADKLQEIIHKKNGQAKAIDLVKFLHSEGLLDVNKVCERAEEWRVEATHGDA